MSGRWLTAIVSAALAGSTTLAIASPAVAATRCPGRTVCFFDTVGGGGAIRIIEPGSRDPWFESFNDKASSWVNNTTLTYCWYYDINYRGKASLVRPSAGRVVPIPSGDNDRASSAQPCDV
jgi:Peptidase inhibitor family I36